MLVGIYFTNVFHDFTTAGRRTESYTKGILRQSCKCPRDRLDTSVINSYGILGCAYHKQERRRNNRSTNNQVVKSKFKVQCRGNVGVTSGCSLPCSMCTDESHPNSWRRRQYTLCIKLL